MVSFKGFWTKKGPEIMHFCLTNLGIYWGYFPMNSVQARKKGPTHKFLKKEKKRKERKKRKEERKEERGKRSKNTRRGKRREKRRKKRRENLTTPPFVREAVKREAGKYRGIQP